MAYNDTGNTALWVAIALQVLRNCDEDTGRKSHIEDAVGLLAALFNLLHVLLELNERVILVVLTRDIGAEVAEFVQLLLQVLCGGLDVRLDALEVFLAVHLGARISDDADVLGKEVVSVLYRWSMEAKHECGRVTYKAEESWELQ